MDRSAIRANLSAFPPHSASLHAGYNLPARASTPPLAEIHHGFSGIARPVGGQHAAPDIEVKRRIGPVARPVHQPVLDRVEVHIVDVPREILLVPNRVLPKT